ncbi:hypothetical protein ABXK61_16160 [Burkholderia sola]|uniref:hypothetical protein n=1 Tax=Burkholderia TaxID=32008 RepID=UPI001AE4C555|nr:hypothetical protein [Burkholderia sp. AcTa6-5]MBP0714840.1 hypothetical protein [Burkholderia sp. AcTa6-5]
MKRIIAYAFFAWLGVIGGMAYTSLRVASTCDFAGAALSINGAQYICAPTRAIQHEGSTAAPAAGKTSRHLVV